MTLEGIQLLMQSHGLWVVGPLAVLEGPIVTVLAGWLSKSGYMALWAVYLVCVLGDLIGDALYYWIGRAGPKLLPDRWLAKLGMGEARQLALSQHFAEKGGRTLLFGKFTHSTGLPIMLASGAARMDFWAYMFWNLVGSLPKSALFVGLGWMLGSAYAAADGWIWKGSLALGVIGVLTVALLWRRKCV